jgi:hypothetical protein
MRLEAEAKAGVRGVPLENVQEKAAELQGGDAPGSAFLKKLSSLSP